MNCLTFYTGRTKINAQLNTCVWSSASEWQSDKNAPQFVRNGDLCKNDGVTPITVNRRDTRFACCSRLGSLIAHYSVRPSAKRCIPISDAKRDFLFSVSLAVNSKAASAGHRQRLLITALGFSNGGC